MRNQKATTSDEDHRSMQVKREREVGRDGGREGGRERGREGRSEGGR